jgi:hypothetical protein
LCSTCSILFIASDCKHNGDDPAEDCKADALSLCAMLGAQPLRHTSLKTRVRFCDVYSCYPLYPFTLPCLTCRPETSFILTVGLPFEGSGWSKIGFGLIIQILFGALRRQARGPCAAFVCVLHLYRGVEGCIIFS